MPEEGFAEILLALILRLSLRAQSEIKTPAKWRKTPTGQV